MKLSKDLIIRDKYTLKDVLTACQCVIHNKGNKKRFDELRMNRIEICEQICYNINHCIFDFGRCTAFAVHNPKERLVIASSKEARIMHWLIHLCIGGYVERRYIEDTYACIRERGTHAAVQRLYYFMRSISNNFDPKELDHCYAFQGDINNFFNSIPRQIVWEKYKEVIGDGSLTAELHKASILRSPLENVEIIDTSHIERVPYHKNMFYNDDGIGMAVGNLPSQNGANLLLNGMDHFIKQTLVDKEGKHPRYYLRYMDDFIILHKDPDVLYQWYELIDAFIREDCSLYLHPNKTKIYPIKQGINFAGSICYPYHISVRPRTRDNGIIKAKAASLFPCKQAVDSVNSYLAQCRMINNYNLRIEMCNLACSTCIIDHKDYDSLILTF